MKKNKSIHEPEARLMSAEEVWDDAQQIAAVVKQNLLKAEPVVQIDIPLSSFLSALDHLNRDELEILHNRIAERLAV
jgi:hypothetical protein